MASPFCNTNCGTFSRTKTCYEIPAAYVPKPSWENDPAVTVAPAPSSCGVAATVYLPDGSTAPADSPLSLTCPPCPPPPPASCPGATNYCNTDTTGFPFCKQPDPVTKQMVPCCSKDTQCPMGGTCDKVSGRCSNYCDTDDDCANTDHDQSCSKYNFCVSTPLSTAAPTITTQPQGSTIGVPVGSPAYAALLQNITALRTTLNIPGPLKKAAPASGRPFRMTLWHEGVVNIGQDVTKLVPYYKQMTEFVTQKKFNRVFFQLADPYTIDQYGQKLSAYADPEFVVQNMLLPLSSIAASELQLGAVLEIDPHYAWYFNTALPGGIFGNNPTYKDYIPSCTTDADCAASGVLCNKDTKKCAAYCNRPFRACSQDSQCASQTCVTAPPKDIMCNDGKQPCCINFPPGCPNNLEQAMAYIGAVNVLAKQLGARPITTIAFDGESLSRMYGADIFGMTQAWQAASAHAPDVNEMGFAKGPTQSAAAAGTNAAYPEMYWVGELKPTTPPGVGCINCKNKDYGNPAFPDLVAMCAPCIHAIYVTQRNNPQGMLAAFRPLLQPYKNVQEAGVCPLFSIEHFHTIADYSTCVQDAFGDTGFCGTFDGFGSWDWDKFEEFMTLYAQEFMVTGNGGVPEIGVYEWQFVPPQWQTPVARARAKTRATSLAKALAKTRARAKTLARAKVGEDSCLRRRDLYADMFILTITSSICLALVIITLTIFTLTRLRP